MPGTIEPLVETALTFAPWLLEVPVLGRLLAVLAPNGGNEFAAQEALQRTIREKATERATRIARNNRYVLKASDAMQCVEDGLMNGGFLVILGRAILNTVSGRAAGGTVPDLIVERIFECIESKVLKQTSPRVKRTGSFLHRPSKGHGHGRK